MPIHVHIKNADGTAKFNVSPVGLIENKWDKKKSFIGRKYNWGKQRINNHTLERFL